MGLNKDRCRRCGYDMKGLSVRVCPECGARYEPNEPYLERVAESLQSGQTDGRVHCGVCGEGFDAAEHKRCPACGSKYHREEHP